MKSCERPAVEAGVNREPSSAAGSASASDGQVEIFGGSCPVVPHFEGVAALQDPIIPAWLRRVEHPSEQPVEGNLPAQTLEVHAVTTRLVV